jgi:hypothetical protein
MIVFVARYLDLLWLYVSLYNTGMHTLLPPPIPSSSTSYEDILFGVYRMADIPDACEAASEYNIRS